jgi:ADP-ribose pyrophosphatase
MGKKSIWAPQLNKADARWLRQEVVHEGFMRLVKGQLSFRTFRGDTVVVERELVQRSSVVAVLPYDPWSDRVVLLEQVRPGCVAEAASPWLLEVVAGLIDADETAPNAAQRELHEETGLTARYWLPMHDYWVSPGGSDERVTLSCALINSADLHPWQGNVAEHEDIKCHVFTRSQAIECVADGLICNGVSLIALQWLALHGDRIMKQYRGV